MTRSLGNVIADSLQLSLSYAERLLKDISPQQFARFAAPGGKTVESNHPAFTVGHLSLYGPRILTQLGRTPTALPEGFEAKFSKDAHCTDDVSGENYPPMETITNAFFEGYQAAMIALRETPDAALQQANPIEGRMADLFPSLGSLHNFYAGGHLMMHLGQVSAWRRMSGLGPA